MIGLKSRKGSGLPVLPRGRGSRGKGMQCKTCFTYFCFINIYLGLWDKTQDLLQAWSSKLKGHMDSTEISAQVPKDKTHQLNADSYEGLTHTQAFRLKMKDRVS